MAITYDSSANAGSTSSSSLSYSHTCTGSNLGLVVFVKVYNTSNLVTGVTYGGVAMTKNTSASGQDADNRYSYTYTLANPSTGANNVVVSLSSATYVNSTSQSYAGCNTSSLIDSTGAALNTSSTTVTTTTTTVADNCWLVGSFNGARIYTPGAGTTQRQTNSSADYIFSFDSNGAKTPAGSHSLAGTQASSANSRSYIISIAPFSAATSHIKSADGILYANIKSADGVTN